MSKLPFIIVENDIDIRLTRLLILISELSYSSKKNPILTIDKIAVYDFLLRYPTILYRITKIENFKKSFDLEDYEFNNIESNYPDLSILYDYTVLTKLLQILICYGYVSTTVSKEAFYIITDAGNEFLSSLTSEYIKRLKELVVILLQMRTLNFQKLNKSINLAIDGGNIYE
jgi:hypothetical protein